LAHTDPHSNNESKINNNSLHGSGTDNKRRQEWAPIDLLLPGGRELLGALVVAGKAVDPALNKNKPEFGVLVLPVPLQMLPNRHSLLNQEVEILRDLRRQPYTRTSDASAHHTSKTNRAAESQVLSPWALRMRRILLPVTLLTSGIPCWSRSRTPICDGIWPFFAALVIISSTCQSTACKRVNRQTASPKSNHRE